MVLRRGLLESDDSVQASELLRLDMPAEEVLAAAPPGLLDAARREWVATVLKKQEVRHETPHLTELTPCV